VRQIGAVVAQPTQVLQLPGRTPACQVFKMAANPLPVHLVRHFTREAWGGSQASGLILSPRYRGDRRTWRRRESFRKDEHPMIRAEKIEKTIQVEELVIAKETVQELTGPETEVAGGGGEGGHTQRKTYCWGCKLK